MGSINNVLITGGTGFVGYWLQQTRPAQIHLDCLDSETYKMGQWKWHKYDAIIHLANIPPADVLRASHGARILYASSGAVYDGRNDYAYHKRMREAECRASGQDVVIARLFSFVGQKLKNLYAITNFIHDALNTGTINIRGNGKAVRSYLYGQELGTILWALLFNGEKGCAYDVGGKTPYTILQVARTVAEIVPAKIRILDEPGILNEIYLPHNVIEERIGLKAAIERTIHDAC